MEQNQGLSPQYNLRVNVLPETEYLTSYADAITSICTHARKHSVAMTTVDGCLRLLALKSDPQKLPRAEEHRASIHALYHIGEGVEACALSDRGGCYRELTAMGEIPPVVDLIAHNMFDSLAFPIFLLGDDALLYDLIMGRLRVFAQFDMRRFFDMVRVAGLTPSWETRRKSEEYKKISEIIPGSPDSRGVRVKVPGLPGDFSEQVLLSGFFRR